MSFTIFSVNVHEIIPYDMPEPLSKAVGKSLTGCLHFVNKTPVDWYTKKQTTVETAIYGSKFVAAKTEQIMDIRQTLRYLVVPICSKSYLFGNNRSVVTSTTLPHSTLTKCHNILAFHRDREATAAKIMAFYLIQSACNLSDMLSKHWDHPSAPPMILNFLLLEVISLSSQTKQHKKKEKKIL